MNAFRIHLSMAAALFAAGSVSAAPPDPAAFADPPDAVKPRTWMHALNGNLSKEGFTLDFEAMKDAGLGGALFFHISQSTPRGPIDFGSEAFHDVLVHAAEEAQRLGLEMGLHNADGWTSSGGPWVTPEQSMKRVAWSESLHDGTTGTLRVAQPDAWGDFYRDIAVVAWPASPDAKKLMSAGETLTASPDSGDPAVLRDADTTTDLQVGDRRSPGERWLQASYAQPVTLRSILVEQGARTGLAELFVSDDGESFEKVTDMDRLFVGTLQWSLHADLPEGLTARHFRVVFNTEVPVRRFELSADARVGQWQNHNAMSHLRADLDEDFPPSAILPESDIRVLHRGPLTGDTLEVDLPEGPWTVARFGYTSTGAMNNPATHAGRGLEVDKLDASALDHHFARYVGEVVEAAQARGLDSIRYSEIDSFEVGGNNWTAGFGESFQERYDYDLIPWLPAFTGRVVDSPEASFAVLNDMRTLVSDLMTHNYYKRFTELCHEHGMKSYIEPYGINGTVDGLTAGGMADIPMGEFWWRDRSSNNRFKDTLTSAVSSARIYGKPIVSAEAYTEWHLINWRGHPFLWKVFGDHAWTAGVNETMFHRFAHQPNTHVKPGSTMGRVGSHIDRHQTWWSNAGKAWFGYLARGSYLLRQGIPSSDVLCFIGDQKPSPMGGPKRPRGLPLGFNADNVNADVLLNRIEADNGKLVLPEGTTYRVLALQDCDRLRLSSLRRLEELARAGVPIVGPRPTAPLGYTELTGHADEFDALVEKLWGPGEDGKGPLVGNDLSGALKALGLGPDLRIDGEGARHFTRRRIGGGDLYFFYNDSENYETLELDFRVDGGQAELWDADSGRIEAVADERHEDGRTRFTLPLEPYGGRFVYFRPEEAAAPVTEPAAHALLETLGVAADAGPRDVRPLELTWNVTFDPDLGGPGSLVFDRLQDWTDRSEEGVRHYSGTAVYEASFELPETWDAEDSPVALDLGDVDIAAVVTLNGQAFDPLWKPPFAVFAQEALRAGTNHLRVEVTNVWTNRLIGDEAIEPNHDYNRRDREMPAWFVANQPPPESGRITFTTYNFYDKEELRILEPSGLKGPVRLVRRAKPAGR